MGRNVQYKRGETALESHAANMEGRNGNRLAQHPGDPALACIEITLDRMKIRDV